MNNVLTEIDKAIDKAVMIVGKYPNKLVMGINKYTEVLGKLAPMVFLSNDYGTTKTLWGIPITIDYDRKNIIEIGYMQEIEAGEIHG